MHPPVGSAEDALVLLIVFVAFALILGGRRGGAWAMGLILAPIRVLAERRIAAAVAALVALILAAWLGVRILR